MTLYEEFLEATEKVAKDFHSYDYTEPVRLVSESMWELIKERYPERVSEVDGKFYFGGLQILIRHPIQAGTPFSKDEKIKQRCKERLEMTLRKRR